MTETIGNQPWLAWPQTQAVMRALQAKGGAEAARFVGGCVRNAVLGLPVDDIDIATRLRPDQVVEALATAGLRSAPTGVEHGTITGIAEGRAFEITTLRRDVSTDGRRAVVAFTEDWSQDAQRRDFRLNALYADLDGRLFDPTGSGIADARAGRIVFVGDPVVRIGEDYLRILRFFRFLAWYGRGEPDAAALAACAELKESLARCSAERTAKELLKLLAAADPRGAVRLMDATGVLKVVLPAAGGLKRFERLVAIELDQLGEGDPELRLAALLPSGPEALAGLDQSLRLSNAQKARLASALGAGPQVTASLTARELRRAAYRLGRAALRDRIKLAWAESGRPAEEAQWLALLADDWRAPRLPVTGRDALAAGALAGPEVGRVLREVEDWWIENDFPDDRALALQRLRLAVEAQA